MALLVPNGGELLLLTWAVTDATPPSLQLRLYANDYTPVDASTAGSFTEASFTGYVSKTLARDGWGSVTTNGDGKAEVEFATPQTFNSTSSETIYGYYVTENDSNTVVWAERFASARSLTNGDSLSITPKLTLANET
ncbi:hypothetical protein Pan97_21270 [Bremerella volcania]|uniref:Uncharacterized protein n=1 Tax=Bremerella volcania TaxID=2527984 RepID=A0A518C7A2_9BACT|nr:hypothetical protein [Bremerella volcania]QDU75105.1 hypothetical protein Pan97_21270 [Bremerella volcania]